MTALLFLLEPERLCLAMDTCSTSLDSNGERTPGPFCSKILLVPHMHAVVCGTGVRSVIYAWHAFVQERVVARDVTQIDNLARAKLPSLAAEHGVSAHHTSTIYHFGFCAGESRMRGFAYRSSNGFRCDPLDYGFGVKPPDGIDLQRALDGLTVQGLPAGFISVMQEQKAHDDCRPLIQRVGIGGEIQFLVMDRDGYSLRTCHRFADYERHFDAAMARTIIP